MASWPLRRLTKPLVALVVFAAIVALATAAAWSLAVGDLATTATQLDETDLALGSAAVTRAATAQAVLVAVDNSNGTATDEAFANSVHEVGSNLEAYDQLRARVESHPSGDYAEHLGALSAQGEAVIGLIAAGDIEAARATLEGDFEAAYQGAVAALADARTGLVADVAAARSTTGSTATAVRLAVILGLPALLLMFGWFAHRRRVRQVERHGSDRLEAAVARGDRMEHMLLAVSHRLRTPLTSIYGLSDVLMQTKRIQGLDRELATLINAESANLHRVAEDVLAATQLESGKLEVDTGIVPLHEVVEEVAKPARATGMDIKVDCPQVWVVTDEPKLRHILRNLLSNSVQHGAEPVVVSVTERDGSVECAVSDHGPGLDETGSVAGRGLDVAYGLADLIGATLETARADGMTTFRLAWSEGEMASEQPQPDAADPGGMRTLPRPLSEEPIVSGDAS